MKRTISKENTFMVAILTETGASFSEEGVDFVQNWLSEQYPELKDRAIIAMMGKMVYKPNKLATALEANPNMFIVMSYDGGENLKILNREDNTTIAEDLRNVVKHQENITAWEALNYALSKEVE